MTALQIVLLIGGIVVFIISFFIPTKENNNTVNLKHQEEKLKSFAEEEIKDLKRKTSDIMDESFQCAEEKSERALERITNEKLTAISEFSETVLHDIHKNHEEVMFLYDMLHDKESSLRTLVQNSNKQITEKEESIKEDFNTPTETEIVLEELEDELAEITQMASADNNNLQILELHNAGKTKVEIAKELGLGVGEVKLVIDLFEVI